MEMFIIFSRFHDRVHSSIFNDKLIIFPFLDLLIPSMFYLMEHLSEMFLFLQIASIISLELRWDIFGDIHLTL